MNSSQHSTSGRRLISSAEFKARLGGISEVSRWRREKAGMGPQPVKLNRRNFYLADGVEDYLADFGASRRDHGDAEAGASEVERSAATCTNEGAKGR